MVDTCRKSAGPIASYICAVRGMGFAIRVRNLESVRLWTLLRFVTTGNTHFSFLFVLWASTHGRLESN